MPNSHQKFKTPLELGNYLLGLRRIKKVSQSQVGADTMLNGGYGRIERGDRWPDYRETQVLASYFGVTMQDLY